MRGQKRVYKEMNIFHVVKRLNQVIELLKERGMVTRRSMWLINHSHKNVIDCDDEDLLNQQSSCTSEDIDKTDDNNQNDEYFRQNINYRIK